ncbi:MAG: Flp pilus assembly protein CpaB [Candidatus Limnocylindria bacterium]
MDPKRRARLILIVGVLLALVAGAGTFFFVSSAQQAQPPPVLPTTPVVVAVRDIPARTQLAAADVRIAQVNANVAPPAALTTTEEAIGKVLTQAISINEPLLPTKFAAADRAFTVFPPEETFAPDSPAYRIMTITVPDNFAVGGILVAGDVVDVMYVFPFDPLAKLDIDVPEVVVPGDEPTEFADTVAKIILGPVPILSRDAAVYTIRVDTVLAERLAYIQAAGGTLQMLLRAPEDDRAATTIGATFGSVYEAFRFPIPERVAPIP